MNRVACNLDFAFHKSSNQSQGRIDRMGCRSEVPLVESFCSVLQNPRLGMPLSLSGGMLRKSNSEEYLARGVSNCTYEVCRRAPQRGALAKGWDGNTNKNGEAGSQ